MGGHGLAHAALVGRKSATSVRLARARALALTLTKRRCSRLRNSVRQIHQPNYVNVNVNVNVYRKAKFSFSVSVSVLGFGFGFGFVFNPNFSIIFWFFYDCA